MRPAAPMEREIVAEAMMTGYSIIGSVDDLWTHPFAPMMLRTLRSTVKCIFELVRSGIGVSPSRIKSTANRLFPDDELFGINDIIKQLMEDPRSRAYWDDLMPDISYPHVCPACGLAAYIGLREVICKSCGER